MSRSIHDDDLHEGHDHGGDHLAEGFSRATVASIVAVMVVLGAIGGAVFYFGTEGTTLSVTLYEPSRNIDLLIFAYVVTTDHGTASGIGNFSVQLSDELVYASNVQMAGAGAINIRFSDFVVANGQYTFRLTYRGQAGTSTFTIGEADRTEFIVTSVLLSSKLVYPDEGKTGAIGVRVDFLSDASLNRFAPAPPGANITYRVLKNGISQDAATAFRLVEGKTYVAFNYTPQSQLGNYTVEVTYHNTWVKAGSSIASIVATNITFVHNRPTACTDKETYEATASNTTILFNAGCSTDDGAIVQYSWDFGDVNPPQLVTSLGDPLESHTFPTQWPRTYTGNLTVNDNGPDGGQTGWKTFSVQIKCC